MNPKRRTVWTFVVTSAALFMASLDNLVVTTALPSIREHLHASLEGLQWTVNAYTLTFAVLLLTGATLGERYGRKRMFVAGLGLFTAGSAAAALAPGVGWLIAARAVQGVGAAILIPLTLTLLSAAVPPQRRGLALGAWGAVGGLAIAIGPLVGGAVVEGASWQWIFWLNVPIGIALLPIAWTRLTESREPAGPARPRPGQPGAARHRLRCGAWQRPRLDQSHRAAAHGGWRPAPGGLHRLGTARPRAHAPAPAVPQPRVQHDQRRLAADVLRDVRLDLPAGPVPPGRPGLQPAAGRPAHAAVDRHAGAGRAHRRRAVGPDRRPPAAGDRACPAGDRPRLAGHGHHPDRALPDAGARVRRLRHRDVAVLRARRQRGARIGAPRPGRHRLWREQRDPRARRRVRDRGARRGVLGTRRLHQRGLVRLRPDAGGLGGRRRGGDRGRCGPGPAAAAPRVRDSGRHGFGHRAGTRAGRCASARGRCHSGVRDSCRISAR